MYIPPTLSHDFVDDLVNLFFYALPSMSTEELTFLLETVMRL